MFEPIGVVPPGPRLGLGVALLSYDRGSAISPFTDPASCCDVGGPATGHRRGELGRIAEASSAEEVVGR